MDFGTASSNDSCHYAKLGFVAGYRVREPTAQRAVSGQEIGQENGHVRRTGKKEISGAVEQDLGTTQKPLVAYTEPGRPPAFTGSGRSRNRAMAGTRICCRRASIRPDRIFPSVVQFWTVANQFSIWRLLDPVASNP